MGVDNAVLQLILILIRGGNKDQPCSPAWLYAVVLSKFQGIHLCGFNEILDSRTLKLVVMIFLI